MSNKNARSLRPESNAVSLNLELSNLEHALRGSSLLAELLANHNLPDEESQRQVPHCIAAQLALVNARLRHIARVIRGQEDAETLWAPYNATSPVPLPGEDGDLRLIVNCSPPLHKPEETPPAPPESP